MSTMKTVRRHAAARILALSLVLVLAFGVLAPGAWAVMPTHGDLLRFIPVAISVDDSSVVAYGYFTNLNPDCSVSNFRDFEMTLFMDNYPIVSGSFGTLDKFTIGAEDVMYHTFVFPGRSGLYPGTYICEDDDFAVISCTFDYSETVYVGGGSK